MSVHNLVTPTEFLASREPEITPAEFLAGLEAQSKLLTELHLVRRAFWEAEQDLGTCELACENARAKRNGLRAKYETLRRALTESLEMDRWRGAPK